MVLRFLKNPILILILLFGFQFHPLWAWTNASFQTGDFTGWTVTSGTGPGVALVPYATIVVPGVAADTNGSICPAPMICLNQVENPPPNPNPNNYAAEIFSGAGDLNHGDWVQISQSDVIPATNSYMSFWFAAALNGTHYLSNPPEPYDSDAYVSVNVLVNGMPIYSQRFSWYDSFAALVNDGVMVPGTGAGYGPYMHLPWTQYYYDLSPYVGQTATIQYVAYDCAYDGHYAYGYIDNAQWLSGSQVGSSYTPLPTDTPISTNTATNTPTISPTPTNTATVTATFSPTNTCTVTPTYTPTCVTHVWPDPYNPQKAFDGQLRISCMNSQTDVRIYTISGELVQTINAGTSTLPCSTPNMWGTTYCWNGRNKMGFPVISGIYLYVVQQGIQWGSAGQVFIDE